MWVFFFLLCSRRYSMLKKVIVYIDSQQKELEWGQDPCTRANGLTRSFNTSVNAFSSTSHHREKSGCFVRVVNM